MSRSTHKLRRRLNNGKRIMELDKSKERPCRITHPQPTEIDYEGLAEMFLCSIPTVRLFVKAGILPVRRIEDKRYFFDKESAINILTPRMIDGRLSMDKRKIFKQQKVSAA